MKKVKFNAPTSVQMIPDEKFGAYTEKMEKMLDEDFEAYVKKIQAGSRFQFKTATIGDVLEVPDWYYSTYKSRVVTQPVSFDKYVNSAGDRIPFSMDEAVKHHDVKADESTQTIKSVLLFELVK